MKKPERIGPYTLLKRLGPGEGSRVWLANAGLKGDKVALKLVRPDDEAGLAAIMHEVELCANFDHANVVRMYECGSAKGCTWMAMGLVAGPPGPPAALSLANFRQLLMALVHVHAHHVIHADINMSNLLIDANGDLRLADFGHARRPGQAAVKGYGTPHCMPPEQLTGQALDARADLFSAGVVLYEILTGIHPFRECTPDKMKDSPPPPSIVASGLGTGFDDVCKRALSGERAERYQNAFEFLGAFDAACRHGCAPLPPVAARSQATWPAPRSGWRKIAQQ